MFPLAPIAPLLCLIGLFIGMAGGMLGLGGGIMVIPALTFLFGFSHKQAVGTSVAMLLPPIGILAFYNYWKTGAVDLHAAVWMAAGFAIGAFFGSWVITKGWFPEYIFQRMFAIFMLYVAAQMLFKSDAPAYAALQTTVLIAVGTGSWLIFRTIGHFWMKHPMSSGVFQARLAHVSEDDFEI